VCNFPLKKIERLLKRHDIKYNVEWRDGYVKYDISRLMLDISTNQDIIQVNHMGQAFTMRDMSHLKQLLKWAAEQIQDMKENEWMAT